MAKGKRSNGETAHLLDMSRSHLQRLMKDDDDLADLVGGQAKIEDIMLHLDSKKFGTEYSSTSDVETMKRRKFAEMKAAEQKALILEMERRQLERDLVPASDLMRVIGRAMQSIKNSMNNLPPKVRQAFQAAESAQAVEQMMHDIIQDSLEQATKQLEELT